MEQVKEENKELLNLAVQILCITRIIKDYCCNNMDFDERFENLYALSKVMEKSIDDVLKNY